MRMIKGFHGFAYGFIRDTDAYGKSAWRFQWGHKWWRIA